MIKLPAILMLVCSTFVVRGQAIGMYGLDKMSSSSATIHYQNDFFGHTDYYYSQGIQVAVSSLSLNRSFLRRLMPSLSGGDGITGIALEHNAFTPTSILSDSVLHGDRPYAASLLLHAYHVSLNTSGKTRLTGMATLGVIGPSAGGEEIQAAIHRNTGNDLPKGWQHQIQNGLVLNYQLQYQRNLLQAGRLFAADAVAAGAIGTYNTSCALGVDLQAGWLERTLAMSGKNRFHLYWEDIGTVALVGFNAALQGNLLGSRSPYVIPAADVSRVLFRNTLALHAGFRFLTLSGNFTWLSREFEQGRPHAWGGIQVSYRF